MRRSDRARTYSKKEIVGFPDLLEDEAMSNDRQMRKPSKLGSISRTSGTSTRSRGDQLRGSNSTNSSKSHSKIQKSARELKRERLVREIHNFDKAQIAAAQPDPEEERRKLREIATEQKMRKAVRDILDDMMQTIVVEVSLKLGGAMHAQQNAIKNIVDQYLGNNPVVNDRVDGLEDKLGNSIQTEIRTLLPDVISKLQRDMTERMDTNMNTKLTRNEETTNERLQQFQQEVNSQTSQFERLQGDMKKLESELGSSITNLKTILQEDKNETNSKGSLVGGEVEGLGEKLGALRDDFEELKITATEELKTLEANSKHQEMILQRAIEKISAKKKGWFG